MNKALRIQQICNYKTDISVVEALIETSGNLKPFLVEINHGRFHVFDVTVHHEDTDTWKQDIVASSIQLIRTLAKQISVEQATKGDSEKHWSH